MSDVPPGQGGWPGQPPNPGGAPPPPPPPGYPQQPPTWGAPPPGYGQQQYGQQWGQSPYGGVPYGQGTPKRNGLGIAALVLGVLSILGSFFIAGGLFGVAAIILGALGMQRANRGEADNKGMALAGLITGIIGVIAAALFLVLYIAVWNSSDFENYRDCLEAAETDQDIEDCADEFADDLDG